MCNKFSKWWNSFQIILIQIPKSLVENYEINILLELFGIGLMPFYRVKKDVIWKRRHKTIWVQNHCFPVYIFPAIFHRSLETMGIHAWVSVSVRSVVYCAGRCGTALRVWRHGAWCGVGGGGENKWKMLFFIRTIWFYIWMIWFHVWIIWFYIWMIWCKHFMKHMKETHKTIVWYKMCYCFESHTVFSSLFIFRPYHFDIFYIGSSQHFQVLFYWFIVHLKAVLYLSTRLRIPRITTGNAMWCLQANFIIVRWGLRAHGRFQEGRGVRPVPSGAPILRCAE